MRPLTMRVPLGAVLLGTVLSMSPAGAQSAPEQAPAPESHHWHSHSLFEGAPPKRPALTVPARSRRRCRWTPRSPGLRCRPAVPPSNQDPAVAKPAVPAPPAPALPTVQAVPPGPPQKNLTGEEFALLRVGSTEKEVLAVLGPPSSQVVVPDDDGHLRESLQYWVKGSPMGTVRLDNGRVIQIETKPK